VVARINSSKMQAAKQRKRIKLHPVIAVIFVLISLGIGGLLGLSEQQKIGNNQLASPTTDSLRTSFMDSCMKNSKISAYCVCTYNYMTARYTEMQMYGMGESSPIVKQLIRDAAAACKPTATSPTPTPISTATPTPMKFDANGFPEDAQQVTVADIAKVPSAYDGKKVVFTCDVVSFPKDNNGNAAGLNCTDPNDPASIVQVEMGTFDSTVKINSGDTVRVYGIGQGAATGKNAFGGDVIEALILELHLNDTTTGYQE
jgi:hypothetical protein